MKFLITGVAGFIGADLAIKLLTSGHEVIGVDNLNDYYDVSLKQDRLQLINDADQSEKKISQTFQFFEIDIANRNKMRLLFEDNQFDCVVNLAAQAGVRYSIENPNAYFDANLLGFGNILECCRNSKVDHLVYASSSSVYGANKNFPFSEQDRVDNPVSLYAATKKANELMAHSYAHLYGFRCTGLRFFTVYGPWGRPDMAPFRFASRMLNGEPIPVYNNGDMIRDFTYIDDITEGVQKVAESQNFDNHYNVYNIGRGEPVKLFDFINALEKYLDVDVQMNMLPMQDGDVPRTMADSTALQRDFGYKPKISIDEGVKRFSLWYQSYYSS